MESNSSIKEDPSRTVLESNQTVVAISAWYLSQAQKQGWQLDIPPSDPTAQDIQLIRFVKGQEILGVSLIKTDTGKTQITLDSSSQTAQQAGEDEEHENDKL